MQGKMDSGFDAAHRPGMTTIIRFRHASTFPRRNSARVIPKRCPSKQRAQGMPGAWRAHSLVCKMKKAHKQVTAGSPDTFRHSPREWF
jgi:hypothetical protein